jgi:hypothetical protein
MSNKAEIDRLGQSKMLTWLTRDMPISELVPVYLSKKTERCNHWIDSALIPNAKIEDSLQHVTWDLMPGDGMPAAVKHHGRGKKTVDYFRFGDDSGIEPLVIEREFHGIHEGYAEISEEFRFFHGLYHDRKLDHFLKIDDAGNEQLVATVERALVQIRLKEIRQFLAIKDMHLAIQFDCREHSPSKLQELGLQEGGEDYRKELVCWGLPTATLEWEASEHSAGYSGRGLSRPFQRRRVGSGVSLKRNPRSNSNSSSV